MEGSGVSTVKSVEILLTIIMYVYMYQPPWLETTILHKF